MWRHKDWDAYLNEIAPELTDYEKSRELIEAGADAMLKSILPIIEKKIRAHTSIVSAAAILNSEVWQEMRKDL